MWSVAPAGDPEGRSGEPVDDSQDGAGAPVLRKAQLGLVSALAVFFALQFVAAVFAWRDAEIALPALEDAIVAYGVCLALLVPVPLLRGRWRTIPTALAALAGTVVPVLLSRDLLEMLGPRDVWIGQSMTVDVLFPLLVGLAAVITLLRNGGRREH